MNYRQKYLLAAAFAALACSGCATYPHAAGYGTEYSTTTYIEPYYDGYYYEEPYYGGPRHHRHGTGPQHGYGLGPIMPPRGAGPARHPAGAVHGGRPGPVFVSPAAAHAAGKAAATQAHTAGKIMATRSHTAGKAAAIQMHSAQNAAAMQSKAAAAQMHSANRAAAAQAAEAVITYVTDGPERAMNRFN